MDIDEDLYKYSESPTLFTDNNIDSQSKKFKF